MYIYGLLAVDRKAFEKISPFDQRVFREIMGRVFRDLDRLNRLDNVKALEALRKQGIEFVKVPAESLTEWLKHASAVPRRLIETEKFYFFDVGVTNYLARRMPRIGTPEFGNGFEQFILMELVISRLFMRLLRIPSSVVRISLMFSLMEHLKTY